jgi:hypothetical protein
MNSYQFKFKPDKIKYLTNISTLDSSHTKICEDLIKNRENLPKKELKLDKLKKKLNEINNNIIDDNFITLKSQLITEIENLEFEIIEVKNYDTELDYYSRTYEILFNYYDIIDGNNACNNSELKNLLIENNNINTINTENNETSLNIKNENENENENSFDSELNDIGIFSKKEKLDKLEMLNYLSKLKRKEKKITRKRVKNVESLIKDNNNIFDYLDSTKELSNNQENKLDENNSLDNKLDEKINNSLDNKDINEINDNSNNLFENDNENKKLKLDRASLYEDYKTLLEGYYAQKKSNKVCGNCNIDKILIYSEGIYACIKCGDVERCIIESDTTSYKDPMIEKPTFPYKRKNHFCEWILILSYLTARKSINSNYYW